MSDTLIDQPRPRRKSISDNAMRTIYGKLRRGTPVFGPKLFSPLKIGILEDIMRAHSQFCDEFALRIVLRHHVAKPGYLMKMVAGAQRLDLNGEPAGVVTETQAEFAANRLAKIKPKSAPKAIPASSPAQKSEGGHHVPVKSQSQQCNDIAAAIGGEGNRAPPTPYRKAPIVVVKKSRALSKARA